MAIQQNGTNGASAENLNGAKDGNDSAEVISGGEEAYWALRALGVEQVFGISSVHNVPIFEAIYRLGGIKHVTCRHEQGCVHAADAYARTTGKLGVAIVSTGPGTTNTVTGLYEAGFASSPVMVITGQASSQYYGKGKGFIHENENQLPMLRTVAPHADTVRSRAVLGETIIRVGKAILSGRPVIASATSGLLEATAGYKTARTVTPGDPVALANGLQAAIERWGLSRAATVTDIETARRRHGPEVYRKTVAGIVRSLAK